uniref:Pupal cuticle protein Edg-78E n=1 Tax=Glossina palpalis gambiensis TaxID=67801 RepID=A0A1B0ARJ8_9MUSC
MFKYVLLIAFLALASVYALEDDAHAHVMMDYKKNDAHGHFEYGYEVTNGIGGVESGDGKSVSGNFHFTTKDGTPVEVTYTADENGYRPEGAIIPTAPPTPPAILRALEYIKNHPHVDKDKDHQKH